MTEAVVAADLRIIIVGSDSLTLRVVDELTGRLGATVTVVMRRADQLAPRSPAAAIGRLAGVRLIAVATVDEESLLLAGLAEADVVALLDVDEASNVELASLIGDLRPGVRQVVRVSRVEGAPKFRRSEARFLSDARLAALGFVAAVVRESTQEFVLHGRSFHVANRAAVSPAAVVCGLAATDPPADAVLLPEDESTADVVLAEGTLSEPRTAGRRGAPITTLIKLVALRLRWSAGLLLAAIAVCAVLLKGVASLGWWQAFYLAVLVIRSGPDPDLNASPAQQAVAVVLALVSVAVVPYLTIAAGEALLTANEIRLNGLPPASRRHHVIVAGLGQVGVEIVRRLRQLGVEVVAVDVSGIAADTLRELGVPLILGDASSESTLRAAGIGRCQALVAATATDAVNIEIALSARAVTPGLHVVVRVFDADVADKVRRSFDLPATRSASFLAAPTFASAIVNQGVVATVPVGRRVLLIGDVQINKEGLTVGDLNGAGQARVLAVSEPGEPRPLWSPPAQSRLNPRDRVTVVATRGGMARLR